MKVYLYQHGAYDTTTLSQVLEEHAFEPCSIDAKSLWLERDPGPVVLVLPGLDVSQLTQTVASLASTWGKDHRLLICTSRIDATYRVELDKLGSLCFMIPADWTPGAVADRVLGQLFCERDEVQPYDFFCGQTAVMKRLFRDIEVMATTDDPVLILGESGSGKEICARLLHLKRGRGEYVPVNCGGLSSDNAASQLFGHVHGAFSGAVKNRRGLISAAGEGSVLLDEIGELKLEVQAQILWLIEERKVRPLGSDDFIDVHAKIMLATNRDLHQEIKNGRFLQDLYNRINGLTLNAPPLRERKADLPLLLRFFVREFNKSHDKNLTVPAECDDLLFRYDWIGNVRELRHTVISAALYADAEQDNGPINVAVLKEQLDERIERAQERHIQSGSTHQEIPVSAPIATPSTRSLKIASITLENIRCFANLHVALGKQSTTWTLLLGNNASGKTSFLRALVLGLCDEATATTLLKKLPGQFIRRGASKGLIQLELVNGDETSLVIETEIKRTPDGENELVRKSTQPEHFPWQDIFACAYGVERTKQADVGYERYRIDQAVMTLFDYDASLQNPELILLRQDSAFRKDIEAKLLDVLMLDAAEHRINFTSAGLEISGPWGTMPFDSLSDGFRGTMQWVADFIGWLIYAGRFQANGQLSGIVLIDELEQHLHPRWQRQIIARLKLQFPSVQFFVTTHSPLIAGAVGSILEEDETSDKILHLALDGVAGVQVCELAGLKGMGSDQVLGSPAFDYLVQADPEVEAVLAEASRLAGKDRDKNEERRYKNIRIALKEMLSRKGTTPIEQEINDELYREMKAEIRRLEEAAFGEAS